MRTAVALGVTSALVAMLVVGSERALTAGDQDDAPLIDSRFVDEPLPAWVPEPVTEPVEVVSPDGTISWVMGGDPAEVEGSEWSRRIVIEAQTDD